MDRRNFLKQVGLGCAAVGGAMPRLRAADGSRLNVVLIVCDDLNDFVGPFGGHPQARTPHIDRLAAGGVCFDRAYSNNPICAPSRSSFLTGIYPHTSHNHMFAKWFDNPVLQHCQTLMEYFKANGYLVTGSGKVMHHERTSDWSEFQYPADYGPFWYEGGQRVAHPKVRAPYREIGPVDGSFGALEDVPPRDQRDEGDGWIYGSYGKVVPLELRAGDDRDPTPDERNAAWAAAKLAELDDAGGDQPFFLGVGFIRPHTPLHVPQKYFDMFPLDQVELPLLKEGDKLDTGMETVAPNNKGPLYFRMLQETYGGLEGLREFCRAYLASIAAVDDCVGQVLEALDNSRFRDNTVVILTGDHGWNMGQKDWVFKMSLWEESCRVPLIIRAPGVAKAGGRAGEPVSLVDLYPTLQDLCHLTGDTRKTEHGAPLDGHSLRPFLEDPERGRWDGPDAALSMVYAGADYEKISEMQHYSVRTRDWRYVRYNNGFEELYDHRRDPHEWDNLAGQPEHEAMRQALRQKLDDLTGLKIGELPPPPPTRLEQEGRLGYDFERFDPSSECSVWPEVLQARLSRDPAKVIAGKTSLQLTSPGAAWNICTFGNLEVPPGMTCRIQFDCRAEEVQGDGFLYYILSRGQIKSPPIKVPLKAGEQTHVDGLLTNNQAINLPLVIGFSVGGSYLIDNLSVSRE